MTPDEKEAIKAHLYQSPPVNGVQYQSSFMAILRDARGAAERDLDSGAIGPGKQSVSWLAATGYLVLLGQIGTCFTTHNIQAIVDNNAIIRALRYFSHVQDEPTLEALVALRNALTHDYGLFNRDDKRPLRHHAFNYGAGETLPLVRLPVGRWSGRWDTNIPEEETTIVNLRKVGDLAEEVVATLRSSYEAENLMMRLPLAQFRVRYGMRFRVA
jgi:hypothetical protein